MYRVWMVAGVAEAGAILWKRDKDADKWNIDFRGWKSINFVQQTEEAAAATLSLSVCGGAGNGIGAFPIGPIIAGNCVKIVLNRFPI